MRKILITTITLLSFFLIPNVKALSNTKGDSFPDLPDTNVNYVIFSGYYGGSSARVLYTFNGNENTN